MAQRIELLSQELDKLKQDTKGSRVPGPNRLCLSVLQVEQIFAGQTTDIFRAQGSVAKYYLKILI